ncbi:osteopetrosis-associated transmembrane protein 1 isoform X2 [Nematostella vectensis]|uniref:osteopetrosis-associated transmembrane protein 1 isoform X2 n=1 Tax=Nematostella vectensis TaxID=45351 RepID=UPI00207701B6|nr:osteopetrosis-associated transmembrane protein 1 isoform X2 [Nematostella vectensis]
MRSVLTNMVKSSIQILLLTFALLICSFFHVSLQSHDSDGPKLPEECKEMLEGLARNVSHFTKCAVEQATPFRFCRRCRLEFHAVCETKANIYNKDYGCVDVLVSSEKYQIVNNVYAFAINLWRGSNCENCYDDEESSELKSAVADYFKTQEAVYHCFINESRIPAPHMTNSSSHNSSVTPPANNNMTIVTNVCAKCLNQYIALQKAYRTVAGAGEYGDLVETSICADVVSAMNFTRQRWSQEFQCVHFHKDLVSVVALTVFFCFLPIIFYTAARLNGNSFDKENVPRINYDSE